MSASALLRTAHSSVPEESQLLLHAMIPRHAAVATSRVAEQRNAENHDMNGRHEISDGADLPQDRNVDSNDSLTSKTKKRHDKQQQQEQNPHTRKRTRGRPLGSKNKPKPPIIISKDSATAFRAHILEVETACDVAACIISFAHSRRGGLCVLAASGAVSNVTLRQLGTPGSVITLQGDFEILSLSGAFLPYATPPTAIAGLAIYLAGRQGSVIGGIIAGSLIAAGPVVVVASSFLNASYERLPVDDGERPTTQSTDCIPYKDAAELMRHKETEGKDSSAQINSENASESSISTNLDLNDMDIFNLPPNLLPNAHLSRGAFSWPLIPHSHPPF
ncbi:hypothetical protein KP509_07G054400 [Ceratopteris richardii]|uniref:PPC domain-containing protein n=1 Tax=Ceratopteris richardii TaxID=49495 RepID=A0A8T2UHW7_CERRI|nr:hypothetical protein KP509_07G054400 [Ceratopteris richardii]